MFEGYVSSKALNNMNSKMLVCVTNNSLMSTDTKYAAKEILTKRGYYKSMEKLGKL
jgi:hypothetical protein